jgi:carbonic anhydrase/acetyltransferase-like protein (isoleucine patch superfamily)
MQIRTFEGKTPHIPESTYVDSTAVIIGDVIIGTESSVWPMVVMRGDIHSIRIGDKTSIQDGTVVHVSHAGEFNLEGNAVLVGNQVTVGHQVTLHGCTISDLCLIGMGSIVMDGVLIESEVVLGAGSLVPPGHVLSSGYLWLGRPAKKIRPLTEVEKQHIRYSAQYYAVLGKRHALHCAQPYI